MGRHPTTDWPHRTDRQSDDVGLTIDATSQHCPRHPTVDCPICQEMLTGQWPYGPAGDVNQHISLTNDLPLEHSCAHAPGILGVERMSVRS